MPLPAGSRIGPYEVVTKLGEGGMGEVYRARDTRLKRDVALKLLPAPLASDRDRLARLTREAELLAAINHPNIANIYGIEDSSDTPVLVMELVEGEDLSARIARRRLPLDEALPIAKQIAGALEAAHERGIVHRDLKPANIKIRPDGTVKVLDFGLAKAIDPTDVEATKTAVGAILGTAAYMSPEQARGQPVDKRSDIWAFGCVLYEMLTGHRAFRGETMSDGIAAVLERDPDWSALPPSTPAGLRRLLRRCLQKDRSRRLRDIGDASLQLSDLDDEGQAASVDVRPRSRAAIVTTVGAVLSVIVLLGVAIEKRSADSAAAVPSSSGLTTRLTRITSDDNFSTEPAISPDGTLIVYASDRGGGGQLDLWLQRTAGGEALRLTDDPSDDRAPAFSPDGSLIAFRSNRGGGGVYVMPTLGGDARLVAPGGWSPRFSPDGRRIAYWSGNWLAGQRVDGRAIFVAPTTGGASTRIASGFLTASVPVWSPDGKSVLFFGRKSADSSSSGLFDWWWTPLEGGEPVETGVYRLLIDRGLLGSAGSSTMNPPLDAFPSVWTTKGVLFSARYAESVNLWRVAISERTGGVIPSSLERLTTGAGSDLWPAVDANDRIVFRLGAEGVVSLTLPLDPNAARVQGAVTQQSFQAGEDEWRNSVDASGRWLVYPRIRQRETELWVKDLMTGKERHIVTTPRVALNPVIAPRGTTIAYALPEGDVYVGYVVPVAGGPQRRVCEQCAPQAWLSDGRRMLALDRTPDGVVGVRAYLVDTVDGSTRDLVVTPRGRIGRTDLSRDERWLSFGTGGATYIAPVRPGDPPSEHEWIPVFKTAPGSGERACGWSPDGRLLYLLLERDGFRDLYALRIDSTRGTPLGEPFLVQHLHDPRRRWGSTPLGSAIVDNAFVFDQVEMTGGIWMLDVNEEAVRQSSR